MALTINLAYGGGISDDDVLKRLGLTGVLMRANNDLFSVMTDKFKGHAGAVQRALEGCKALGAKRALLLPMSVPAHSSLMQRAAQGFASTLRNALLAAPSIPFWSPVDARLHATAEDIRGLLVSQLASPVRWTALVQALINAGHTRLVECGPGKVLTGLNRRIDKRPEVLALALQDPASIAAALAS
jgi:[acyl-carrier-protein] S-malonyltransferase